MYFVTEIESINGYDSHCVHVMFVVFMMTDADNALRERLERTRREAEYSRKKLQQQHEETMEEHDAAKKVLERKVSAYSHHVHEHLEVIR